MIDANDTQSLFQRADQRVQRKDFPGIQLDVHRCTSSCIPGKSFL